MNVPLVSVLMVARNVAPFVDAAIRSARMQTLRDIEIVFVDDGSTDDTLRIARGHAQADGRMRLIEGPRKGLSAVRNVSFHAARGRFAAILDSDDILHPGHLERLLAGQALHGGQICVANMLRFEHGPQTIRATPFAAGSAWDTVREVDAAEFVRRGMIGYRGVSLGYLKPLFDLDFLRRNGIAYDERLRIGEDFDLVLRAMLRGARYRFLPQTTYYYRRHPGSTSHRLTTDDLDALIDATQRYRTADAAVREHLRVRADNLEGAGRQVRALAAIRMGRFGEALRLAGRHRHARNLTASSLCESLLKRMRIPEFGRGPAVRIDGEPGNYLAGISADPDRRASAMGELPCVA